MFNQILWTLDSEADPNRFERLCTDLLSREGYEKIIPIGGNRDHGRDAELKILKGIKSTGGVTFFQYSLEKKWEDKLRKELFKVKENGHEIDSFVFVTTHKVTGYKRDQLTKEVYDDYGWNLIIYDREWFRHRLEESHPDLAVKYLGISLSSYQERHQLRLKPHIPEEEISKTAWQLYKNHEYDAASIEFKKLIKINNNSVDLWSALAWCQYSLYHYNEALMSINRAISLDQRNKEILAIKACILTEDGISRGIRANLLLAKDIFKEIANNSNEWMDHYNLGNTLSALDEYEDAKEEFLIAVKLNPNIAEIWKNLGTVYFHLHNHQKELECYDKALNLNKNLSQAIISKGVTLLIVFNKPRKTVQLLERALEIDDSVNLNWPHIWYWLSSAHAKLNELEKALERANIGLSIVPYHHGLLDLKSLILSKLWRRNDEYIDMAISFFKFKLELKDDDYDSFSELMKLYKRKGCDDLIIDSIERYIDLGEFNFRSCIKFLNHTLDDYVTSFRYFNQYKRFRDIIKLSEYVSYLQDHSLKFDKDFENALFIICSIPFGLSCDLLAKEMKVRKPGSLKNVYQTISDSLEFSFTKLSTKLLDDFNTDNEIKIAESFADRMVSLATISLLELSRQFGYIGGIFGLKPYDLDKVIVSKVNSPGKWHGKLSAAIFLEMNKKLNIFNDKQKI